MRTTSDQDLIIGSRSRTYRHYSGKKGTFPSDPPSTGAWSGAYTSFRHDRDDIHVTQKADGWRPPTPYWSRASETQGFIGTMIKRSGSTIQYTGPEFWTYDRYWFYDQWSGSSCLDDSYARISTPSLPSISEKLGEYASANARNRAEAEALAKLYDVRVQIGENLFQAGKTASMLHSKVRRFYGAYSALRKGDVKSVKKFLGLTNKYKPDKKDRLKSSGEAWLETVYGWIPLMSDIYTLAFDLPGMRSENDGFYVQRDYRYGQETSSSPLSFQSVRVGETRDTLKCGYKVRLDVLVADPDVIRDKQMGVRDPLVVGWELVPFSFLIDWVAPIGTLLQAYSAMDGLTFRGGSLTHYYEAERVNQYNWSHGGDPNTYSSYTRFPSHGRYYNSIIGTARTKAFQMSRMVYNEPPRPLPYVKNPVSLMHVANAAALILALKSMK